MVNLFEKKEINSILKDERFLYPEYIPEKLSFRESEIDEIVFCLKPATVGKKPTNLFVCGVPGTGKTVSSKFILNELTEFSDRINCMYINCFETNSKYSILAKATNHFGYAVPIRGMSSDEIFERFVAVIKSKKIIPIFVFDEAEQLLKDESSKELLYDLSRLNEKFGIIAGLVFISNDNMFVSLLDDRVRSSLNPSKILFEKYTSLELKEILKERSKFAFFDNVIDDEVIPLCAAHASKTGDARLAIGVLLKAARLAEKENSKKILIKHVRASFLEEKPQKIEIIENLSNQEKLIIDLLKKNKTGLTSGEIYEKLSNDFAERTLRTALSNLNEKNIIFAEKLQKGKGFTRLIKIKQ
ncbi:MAG: AAA family ATPase [Candidatus ainarchaeum sp.]|nr:AAA family ATPase [Candidatus ainarchaeum sp.]